jgi:hypothetical protein
MRYMCWITHGYIEGCISLVQKHTRPLRSVGSVGYYFSLIILCVISDRVTNKMRAEEYFLL